jgi:hypothetical protein
MKNQIFIIMLILGVFILPVSATIDITPTNVTSSSILWEWSPVTIQNLSIDGIFVCNFNPAATSFVLSDLGPGEPHTITIITAADSGSNTTYTLLDTNVEQSTDLMGFINAWGYLILIIILCVVGMIRRLGIFLPVASAVSLYALYEFITVNVISEGNPLIEIPFIIYVIFFIIPLWLIVVKGGAFK